MNIACVILGILLGLVLLVGGMFVVWAIFGDH
jgi:hypothetical protein